MNPNSITSALLTQVDQVVDAFVHNTYGAMAQNFGHEIQLAFILYVALFGWGLMWGTIELDLRRAARHLLIVAVVYALVHDGATFNLFFYDLFTNGPNKLLSVLVNASSPLGMLSDVFDSGMIACNDLLRNMTWTNCIPLIFSETAVFFSVLIGVAYALYLIILAKLALAVILALAPLFLIFALFPLTKDFFNQYVRQCVNYMMIQVLTLTILSLGLQVAQSSMQQFQAIVLTHQGHAWNPMLGVILSFVILFLLLHQVPGLASALSGGFSLHVGNMPAVSVAAGMLAARAITKFKLPNVAGLITKLKDRWAKRKEAKLNRGHDPEDWGE